ncbi:hypothetical protein AD998_07605 [bacterium 336/3]|nr:hypothetical protein AD998_07605 [bacterium 336/3]
MFEKKGDRLDKYRAYLIKGKGLSEKSLQMLERMNFTNSLLCEGYASSKIIPVIQKKFDLSQRQAYQLLSDTIQLFGDVSQASKEGRRYIVAENLLRLGKKAEQEGDFITAQSCFDKYAKLYGLYDSTEINIDSKMWMTPREIIFSDDISILKGKTEDIEHEIVPTNILEHESVLK